MYHVILLGFNIKKMFFCTSLDNYNHIRYVIVIINVWLCIIL